MSKVLFFGPYPSPITGQSIAFKEVYDNFDSDKRILCNTTFFGDRKLINSVYCFFSITYFFVFYRFDKIYFTCSRSKLGFLKDLQLLIFAFVFNKKVLNHLHGADFKSFYFAQSIFFKKVIKWAYSKIDKTIILLPAMEDQFHGIMPMATVTVANSYSSEYEQLNVPIQDKQQQIVYISNIMESKGILVFLDAVALILDKHPFTIIKIAGKPMADDYSSVQEIEFKFNIRMKDIQEKHPERLFYLGVIKGKEKEQILLESAIFVLPTFYKTEASPISIIEAMRFGNAIITTNHNYLPSMVTTANGFLVKPKSSLELKDKLSLLLLNKSQLISIQSSNIVEAKIKYSPKKFNLQISSILMDL